MRSYEDLVRELDRSLHLYNFDKPHIRLYRKTPNQFEIDLYLQKQSKDGNRINFEHYLRFSIN
jgi:hypothetical protein